MRDRQLRQDILDELDFEPFVCSADLGIVVIEGIATLTGQLPSLSDKTMVIDIVESIRGVRAVTDKIEVRRMGSDAPADETIARRVTDILTWNGSIPADRIQVTVEGGWVTLRGEVEWRYQSFEADRATRCLIGVTGIDNLLEVVPTVPPSDICDRILQALRRNAEIDTSGVRIAADGNLVTLEGEVRHLAERRSIEWAAWASPGVAKVVNRLDVI